MDNCGFYSFEAASKLVEKAWKEKVIVKVLRSYINERCTKVVAVNVRAKLKSMDATT